MFESPNQNYQCFLISRMCYWDMLTECSVLLKMTAQRRSLTGTSSQEETNFHILALGRTLLWEQILLVTVWIPVPPPQLPELCFQAVTVSLGRTGSEVITPKI